jgi:hypothetical protein
MLGVRAFYFSVGKAHFFASFGFSLASAACK